MHWTSASASTMWMSNGTTASEAGAPGGRRCADARVVAAGGMYACPILAGLPGMKLSSGSLVESVRQASLYHPACVTCYETGMSCRN